MEEIARTKTRFHISKSFCDDLFCTSHVKNLIKLMLKYTKYKL